MNPGTIYLLHFSSAYKHARHYLGWTTDLEERLARHREGRGARLIEVITEAGITFEVAKTWRGDRNLERRMKGRSLGTYCPLCKTRPREPELPVTPAEYVRVTADKIARGTKDAYSFDRYGFISWRACCVFLLRQGRKASEVWDIMRSRAPRAAADFCGKKPSSVTFGRYMMTECVDWRMK